MGRFDHRDSRRLVLIGFSLMALGSLVTLAREIDQSYFSQTTSSGAIEAALSPLMPLVALWAWWWLTRLKVSGDEQQTIMRRALYGLSLQYLIYFALTLTILVSAPSFVNDWRNLAQWWTAGIGALAASIGFFSMARGTLAESDDLVVTD